MTTNKQLLQEVKVLKMALRKVESKIKKKKPVYYRYECVTWDSYKFWELRGTVNGFYAFWGRIGSAPAGKKYYTYDQAQKMIKQKEAKGYVRVN